MNRRDALALTTRILGGTLIGSQVFLAGCQQATTGFPVFNANDLAFLDEVGETIIPTTDDSPGARAADIGAFMNKMITDCYSLDEARTFYKGIDSIRQRSQADFSTDFMQLSPQARFALLHTIDLKASQTEDQPHYFRMMKELTLWGYFSSEAGVTQALRYNPIPGRFEGCVPYDDEPAWA